jgi:uncharacterized LabA/DUF88 family protein
LGKCMSRVISYIDGFNLYFGLRAKGWRKYYWLDLPAMSSALLKPGQQLEHCHYFTARVNSMGHSQSKNRQSLWLDALSTMTNLTVHEGHYLAKQQHCKSCGAQWTSHEEKMTDVNIATQLLLDAFDNRFDTALVISGDSDLTTPILKVRSRFPAKRIIVVFPPDRRSAQLKQAAHGNLVIGEDKLRQNLLPNQIATASGFVLHRPQEWY